MSATAMVTRAEVEDFLIAECDLLDSWKLLDWAKLFTADGHYLVPPLDVPDGDPGNTLFLIYDDADRVLERARRLLNRNGHAEFPHSRTMHMVSNVRLLAQQGDEVQVQCNFLVTRAKGPINDTYPGRSFYRLVKTADGLRIREKRAVLALTLLRPQGKVSIIL